jgi:hypothetical protein
MLWRNKTEKMGQSVKHEKKRWHIKKWGKSSPRSSYILNIVAIHNDIFYGLSLKHCFYLIASF